MIYFSVAIHNIIKLKFLGQFVHSGHNGKRRFTKFGRQISCRRANTNNRQ